MNCLHGKKARPYKPKRMFFWRLKAGLYSATCHNTCFLCCSCDTITSSCFCTAFKNTFFAQALGRSFFLHGFFLQLAEAVKNTFFYITVEAKMIVKELVEGKDKGGSPWLCCLGGSMPFLSGIVGTRSCTVKNCGGLFVTKLAV